MTTGGYGTFSAASQAGHSVSLCVLTSDVYTRTFNLISSQWISIVSDATCVGDGDTIKIYDGSGKLVGTYTGCDLAGQTLEIIGSTVTIELISDSTDNDYYGFAISSITGVPFSILPLMWEATKKVK